jgi:acetolactate synthase I/II/III large subunit
MKLSDYVVRFVAQTGAKHVFMLPGGGAMHLNDSLGRCRELQYVCNLHEQASAIAAEAYARVTGNLGVCMVTTGPGGTNAITGLAGAWLESTPCLFLSGQVKRADLKRDLGVRQLGVQELDIVEIVRALTKYAVIVTDPTTIRYHLEKAVALARHGRPGPVWIDIPLDVQAAPIDESGLVGFDRRELPAVGEPPQTLQKLAARTVQLVGAAERPVLLVGNGVHDAGAEAGLRHLIDRLRIPVLRTWIGADLLPDDHPLCFGKPGVVAGRGANFALQNADFLLSIGARLDFAVTGYDQSHFARAARKVVVDVDRAELKKLGKLNIDVPVWADAKAFLGALLDAVSDLQPRDRAGWLGRCREWKARYPVVLPEYQQQSDFINTYQFTSVLSDEMAEDELIIPGSSGAALDTFWLAVRLKGRQRAVATGGLGAMGYGLPAAVGGAVAAGGRRVVSVDGDGGFQLNIQELATVARLGLPIKFFILNNNGYASIRASQRNYFKTWMASDPGTGLKLPDTVKVAEAYGVPAVRVADPGELRARVAEVLARPGPVVCEVMIHPDQTIGPRVSSAVRADGSIVSRPLEDLWPFLARDEFKANMIVEPLPD